MAFKQLQIKKMTLTGNITLNSYDIINASTTTGLVVGDLVYGTGIPADTRVTNISGSTITLDKQATLTSSGVTFTINTEQIVTKYAEQLLGGSMGGGASITISEDPPASPSAGDLWWKSTGENGGMFVYYTDADSSQWVQASHNSFSTGSNLLSVATNIIPNTTNTYDIGSSDYGFRNLHLSGDSIYLGGIILKENNNKLELLLSDGVTPAAIGGTNLSYKGNIDASTDPNYPSARIGDSYRISVAGKIGGSLGKSVDIGDMIVSTGISVSGNESTVGQYWNIIQGKINRGVSGSESSTDGYIPVWSGSTGRILSSGYSTSGTGSVALTNSPAFTTPSLGVATATSINNLAVVGNEFQPNNSLSVTGNVSIDEAGTVSFLGKTITVNSSIEIGTVSANSVLYTDESNIVVSESTLSTVRGGTGISSFSGGDMLYTDQEDTLSKLPIGNDGEILKVVNNRPKWEKSLTEEEINSIAIAMAIALG
jgi:hypothetical protein